MPTMKFTIEEEKEKRINFVDITVMKDEKALLSIYTETPQLQTLLSQMTRAIPINIHKLAAITYLSNRIET
jgi:hypothetical protein